MNSFSSRMIPVIVLLLAAPAIGQQFPTFDPERFFMMGDADLDGRISLDEYGDLSRRAPRIRDAATSIESRFRRIDGNHDGFLSLTEYRKSFPLNRRTVPTQSNLSKEAPAGAELIEATATPEQVQFFEKKIRPVLVTQCGMCHSEKAEKLKGGLRLDSREGIRVGGDSGPAIVLGQPDDSLLIRAIRYRADELQMPPSGKLSDSVIADLEAWVTMGAPDSWIGPASSTPNAAIELSKAREFWSFKPPKKLASPPVTMTDWPRGEIDRFLLANLEAAGLSPVSDASRPRLLRRITFDLVGLPPTPQELDAFVQDDSPDAFAKTVDRLLMSPHFGERWGRHWLDVARYAESSGKTNFTYPQAWRYRDWTIDSLNTDKPYNQFVREQISGDLLPFDNEQQRAEQLIATGFLAIGSKAHDAENRGQFILDVIDEQIEATTRAFLGMTVACARCHDHKIDPISQRDYYALSGILRSTQTCSGTLADVFPNFNASPLLELPTEANVSAAVAALSPEQRAAMQDRLNNLIRERDAIPRDEANRDQLRRTNSMLATLRLTLLVDRPGKSPRAFAMGVRERDEPVDSALYIRGELDQPGTMIPRGLISLFSDHSLATISSGSGRRELSEWLASPSNPLTARVMVNRVWLHLFGRGLVATSDNFGAAGARPSHPELLDALAVDFMNDGWSIKRLIRRIVMSRAYGLDSSYNSRNFEKEPDNALVWRMSKRRLEAEILRDSLLFVGNRLDTTPHVGSPVASTGEGLAFFVRAKGLDVSSSYRSIYLPVIRDQVPETFALFDFADPSVVTGERATTTGPAQALYFMNGPLVIRQADALAERILMTNDDETARINAAYRIALSRESTLAERDRAVAFFNDFAKQLAGTDSTRRAWSAFCQAILASAEFRYLD